MSHPENPQPHVTAYGLTPGSIVRCRNRDWVLLPSDSPDVYLLRPLTGTTDEVVAIHKQLTNLIGYDLPEERVRSHTFPLPSPEDLADAASAHLLWQAARLTLREGATPFRSLGRISIRPRIYQFVPLLMALRLDPVRLLHEGFHPILWCRYIATAEYVAERLRKALRDHFPDLRVVAITGRIGDEERRTRVEELAHVPRRVLVATDCLSEGVNLQNAFTAVPHYDLPWNPNRLEQREGRVDRYGQTAPLVKAVRYFSPDSAVDGIVLGVLRNKAREIHRTLGTYMPVPEESESVTEAVLNALCLRGRMTSENQLQLDLGFEAPQVASLHARWEQDAERERINRTRFAQRALKPDEVRRELEATDAVLGDPDAVREFVLNAAQRLGLAITRDKRPEVYRVAVGPAARVTLPTMVTYALPVGEGGQWCISFTSPTPEGAEYLGRNHRFVAALARFLMEEALTKHGHATASRCGVIRTRAVSRLTTISLLRVRYLLHQPERAPLLSEAILVVACTDGSTSSALQWLAGADALNLLAEAKPDANVPMAEKRELVAAALDAWPTRESALRERIALRAAELEKSHKRVRQAVSLRVRELTATPQLPPDLLGLLVLQPVV